MVYFKITGKEESEDSQHIEMINVQRDEMLINLILLLYIVSTYQINIMLPINRYKYYESIAEIKITKLPWIFSSFTYYLLLRGGMRLSL
jgi:hypothetical protein